VSKSHFSGLKNEEFCPARKGEKNGPKQHVFYFLCRIFTNLVKIVQELFLERKLQKSPYFEEKKLYTS
jgi:hypothetical protein